MSTYDDEMYKFIAAKDNFDVAAEIYNLFPGVKERMIKEFWEAVKEKFHELDTNKKWKFEIDFEDSSLSVYKDNWDAHVCVANIDKSVKWGIWFDQTVFDQKLYDEDYGREVLAKNEAVNWTKKGKAAWFYSEDSGDNFQEIATLKKCTNGSRESFVNEWAKVLLDLANNTKEDLEKINQKRT